mmetsp:Transcript_13796/g.32749  ORF Transcript_13796/g.32749 Transcript_13796/m.32749 type:complete len:249 (-) Transcript_13796:4-750(-)
MSVLLAVETLLLGAVLVALSTALSLLRVLPTTLASSSASFTLVTVATIPTVLIPVSGKSIVPAEAIVSTKAIVAAIALPIRAIAFTFSFRAISSLFVSITSVVFFLCLVHALPSLGRPLLCCCQLFFGGLIHGHRLLCLCHVLWQHAGQAVEDMLDPGLAIGALADHHFQRARIVERGHLRPIEADALKNLQNLGLSICADECGLLLQLALLDQDVTEVVRQVAAAPGRIEARHGHELAAAFKLKHSS